MKVDNNNTCVKQCPPFNTTLKSNLFGEIIKSILFDVPPLRVRRLVEVESGQVQPSHIGSFRLEMGDVTVARRYTPQQFNRLLR